MKRFLAGCIAFSILLLPAISFSEEKETLSRILRAQETIVAYIAEQNEILKARMGVAVAQNNEARMTNVLLCNMAKRFQKKLIKRLCAAIMLEYESVQKVLDAPKVKGDKS